MWNATLCSYRGYTITTRWADIEVAKFGGARRFTASFSVDHGAAGQTSWQRFPEAVFDTCEHAVANALKEAKASIDVYLGAS